MALYRILSRTLLHKSPLNDKSPTLVSPSFRRHRSSTAELIEIDLDSISSPAKMEEMLQRIMVQKATPDWLPFRPGSSFWVPPPDQGPRRVVDLMEKLGNKLTPEEFLSLTTDRGWPCFSFFVKDRVLQNEDVLVKFAGEDVEEAVVVIELLTDPDSKS